MTDEDRYIESLIRNPLDDVPDVPDDDAEFPTEEPDPFAFDLTTYFLLSVECSECSCIHEQKYDFAVVTLASAQKQCRSLLKRYGWRHIYDPDNDRHVDVCDQCAEKFDERTSNWKERTGYGQTSVDNS